MLNLNIYGIKDLEYWANRVEETARGLGINFYPQEFEIIDYKTMLERKTYAGMLSFYPHWSSGKRYEISSTFYRLGLEYLPYELVIATNPCLACLMDSNDLAMQILTQSHVYGHNNFFKINKYFKQFVKPDLTLDFFRSSAEKIRSYENDPSIGPQAVRRCIDAAHGLRWQCVHFDLLSFLRDNSPRHIAEWERFIINTTLRAFDSLMRPHMLTMGKNEGWATYCHYKIMNALRLPQELRGAFARHHSKVVRLPDKPTAYNHYLVNFAIWNDIEKKYSSSKPIPRELLKIVKEGDDANFIEEHLSEEVAEEVGLFLYGEKEGNIVAKDEDFGELKTKLVERVRNSGPGGIPVISVKDADVEGGRQLLLKHEFDGRHLEPEHTAKTLEYVHYFWGHPVILETVTYRRRLPYLYEYDGSVHRKHRRK